MREFDYSDNKENEASLDQQDNATVSEMPKTESEQSAPTYSVSYGPAHVNHAEAASRKGGKNTLKAVIISAVAVVVMGLGLTAGYVGTLLASLDDGKGIVRLDPNDDISIVDSKDEDTDDGENNVTSGIAATINKHDGDYPKINTGSSITDVVAAVKDSVVEISVTVPSGGFFGQTMNTGAGSGVIIAPEGYIVTNHHVIEDATAIAVRLTDGSEYEATLQGTDESSDIAIIKIEPRKALTVAELGSSSGLLLGEEVIAIGNPLGMLGGTVTRGIISGLERTVNMGDGHYMKLLQTDAAINPGNSGGGLFDLGGKLVGVVNAKYADEDIEGLGFAIPIDHAYEIINDLIDNGYVKGVIDHGLSLMEVGSIAYAQAYFGTRKTGVFVTDSEYSTALKYGDRLVSINGESISTLDDVTDALDGLEVGDTMTVEYERSGSRGTAQITLREYVPEHIK